MAGVDASETQLNRKVSSFFVFENFAFELRLVFALYRLVLLTNVKLKENAKANYCVPTELVEGTAQLKVSFVLTRVF